MCSEGPGRPHPRSLSRTHPASDPPPPPTHPPPSPETHTYTPNKTQQAAYTPRHCRAVCNRPLFINVRRVQVLGLGRARAEHLAAILRPAGRPALPRPPPGRLAAHHLPAREGHRNRRHDGPAPAQAVQPRVLLQVGPCRRRRRAPGPPVSVRQAPSPTVLRPRVLSHSCRAI